MTDQTTPEPDVRITSTKTTRDASVQLGGVDVSRWVTRADLQLDAREYGPPRLHLELDVPGVVAEVRTAEVVANIDPALAALLKAAGWTEPDRGPFR